MHRGHVYHIEQTRALTETDVPIICVMSGSVTQRGDLACLPKWERARSAVKGGANLVIELPAPYACAAGERFALGGVYLLNSTGIVDTLSFGSECGDINELKRAQAALEQNSDRFKSLMSDGYTYAAAQAKAADFSGGANDILGLCYLKAIKALGADMVPITIKRSGAGHDESTDTGFLSAMEVRRRLFSGEQVDLPVQPQSELLSLQTGERLILAALRDMSVMDWVKVPDVSEGLENRFFASVRSAVSLDELYMSVKSKRYTLARIRRIVLCAYLGIPRTDSLPPYIRVLAFDKTGAELLKRMKKTSALPIITKPAHYRRLGDDCKQFFELECKITDKIGLHYKNVQPCGQELRETVGDGATSRN
jgi:predicted nucleotidyltransferase